MRINHNIAALNTYRQLSNNINVQQKSLAKLSSGFRINSAADDAAGLAISEKMRGQIRGLEQATRNAQDGISLIQTAEGALNETHSILQRMRELAVQASNDTNTSADRAEIQKEVDQLAQELARIGNTTEFNTQKLLNGTFIGTFHIGANENQGLNLSINDMRGYALGMVDDVTYVDTATLSDTNITQDIADGTYEVRKNESTGDYELINSDGVAVATSSDGGVTYIAKSGDDTYTFHDKVTTGTVVIDYTGGKATGTARVTNGDGTIGLEAGTYTYDFTNKELKNANGEIVATSSDDTSFTDVQGNTLFTLGSAVTADTTFEVRGINISDQNFANSAITAINTAIETVSTERAKLGAYQNRLEHTINNLGTSAENLTASESRIRDVDMAKEMMEFTKLNILSQAAQVMLERPAA